jgi:putative ABC transport system permease protein
MLDRKLLRDLWHMRGLVLAIILVMGSGIATYVMSRSALVSLTETREIYYERYRFADVFAAAKRAPLSIVERMAEIPGVITVYPRVVFGVTLDLPDMAEPATGRIISVPDGRAPPLNALYLKQGRWLEPRETEAVLISEAFADARGLMPGDSVTMVVNGHKRSFSVAGIVLSPEYVFSIAPGAMMPDDKRFGVFWMSRHALEAMVDMDGAFNDVSLRLLRNADPEMVMDRVDRLLAPYGGLLAYGREDQVSDWYLYNEITQLKIMALFTPLIFLGVAAFLLHVVLSRLVATQREQIGSLKALGYSNLDVSLHFIKFFIAVAIIGGLIGGAAGAWLGAEMTELYTRFYRFPVVRVTISPWIIGEGTFFCMVAALTGALSAVRAAATLPPAEAMRPPAPPRYRLTMIERLGLQRFFSQPVRIILRQFERRPIRSLMSCLGVGMSVGVFVASAFFLDAIDYITNVQFNLHQRQDVTVSFVEPRGISALHEIRSMPGILRAEPLRTLAVELVAGNRTERTSITGLEAHGDLYRLIDADLKPVAVPEAGLLIDRKLADILKVGRGDTITARVLEGRRPTLTLTISAVIESYLGISAYAHIDTLNRAMNEPPVISGAALSLDAQLQTRFFEKLKATPAVASSMLSDAAIRAFEEVMAENITIMTIFNVFFAGVITYGVVYNLARIAFSERARELAGLRVLGFKESEVSFILLGELALVVLFGIPLGCGIGYGLAVAWAAALDTELYRIPVVIEASTYGYAILIVIGASIVSGLSVMWKMHRLDLLSALKTGE